MKRRTGNPVIAIVREGYDYFDHQASVLIPFFAVCEVMSCLGILIPRDWQYGRSPYAARPTLAELCRDEDHYVSAIADAVRRGDAGEDDLRIAGEVLVRLYDRIPESKRY